mgnify:FL=1
MKRNLFYCLTILLGFTAHAQESLNINFLSSLDYDYDLSDVWGYATSDGEYALVGAYNGISVVDVTNATSPNELAFFSGPESIWRDLKTWDNYLYCINETGAGLQIVNLSEVISNAVNPTYIENTNLGFTTAHNIFIDKSGILYVFGSNYGVGGCIMFDLNNNPENPEFLGVFNDYYFHDGMVRGDTLWGGAINNGVFSAIDVSDKSNPIIIGSHPTPNTFSHNCWISDDGNSLFTTDEVSGAYVAAYDVSDLSNIEELDRIQAWSGSSDVIPHNTHVNGDFIVTSYYTDGVSVVDVSNPSNLVEVAFYDTSDDYDGNGFNGAWGAYPWLPSGNILVTDIENGLFVLEPKYTNASFVSGVVTDDNDMPISNVLIQIEGTNYETTTSLDGSYATGVADEGTYTLTFSAPGYQDQSIEVNLSSLQSLDFSIQLIPLFDAMAVQISVVDALSFVGVASAFVTVYNNDFEYNWTSNQDGSVAGSLFPGTYSVSVGFWGFQTVCSQITVEESSIDFSFELEKGYSDDFSIDLGWTVENEASLSAGAWERGQPNGTEYQSQAMNPNSDASGDCGSQAFITGNASNATAGQADVDDGRTTLYAPLMDLSSYQSVSFSYSTWFQNAGGQGSAPNDSLLILLNNGIETILLDFRVASTASANWQNTQVDVPTNFELTQNMQLLVATMDYDGTGHLVEAGFDKFSVSGLLSTFEQTKEPLSVYPNPSFNGFLILNAMDNDSKLLISDVSGKLISTVELSKGENSNDLSYLAKGTYLIELRSSNESLTTLWIRN